MPTTVTIQRVGLLDLSSITDLTIPVMVDPINVNVAFSPRYWAYRHRLASFGSVVSIVCMLVTNGRGTRKQFQESPQDISEPLSKNCPCGASRQHFYLGFICRMQRLRTILHRTKGRRSCKLSVQQ
jgi:hypothetical protein